MSDEATSTVEFPAVPAAELTAHFAERHAHAIKLPVHIRLGHGMRKTHNWLQFVRFGAVGATGYAVNIAVFALCVHLLKLDYRVSAVVAWSVSVLNNFWFNRHWTFRAKQAHPVRQGVRFFAVSLVVFGFSYAVLVALVSGAGMTKVVAQAIAVAAGTPLNFVGQKLWSFRV